MKKFIVFLICGVLVLAGCVTTKFPDGRTETEFQTDQMIAVYQATLPMAQMAFDMWLQYQETQEGRDEIKFQREKEQREAMIQNIKDALEALQTMRNAQAPESEQGTPEKETP